MIFYINGKEIEITSRNEDSINISQEAREIVGEDDWQTFFESIYSKIQKIKITIDSRTFYNLFGDGKNRG